MKLISYLQHVILFVLCLVTAKVQAQTMKTAPVGTNIRFVLSDTALAVPAHVQLQWKQTQAGLQQKNNSGKHWLITSADATILDRTVRWMAAQSRKEMVKINLSTMQSKYAAEVSKNLDRIFAEALASGTILLFDEADALFGNRSDVKESNDSNANTITSYLLQKIEAHNGLILITSNCKTCLEKVASRSLIKIAL